MSRTIVWTIAGSDPSGGAGIQADLHTFHALGVHACSVITAITAQNSVELKTMEFCSPQLLTAQLQALSEDLPPRAIKLGMVGSLASLKIILPYLERFPQAVVYDPVLFASVGGALHEGELHDFLTQHFLKRISVFTPNIPEAEWFLGRSINSTADIEEAGKDLQALGPKIVLLKGGHAPNHANIAQDYWTNGNESGWLSSPRLNTPHLHGTGCTLASAIAANLAQGYETEEALVLAKAYVNQAIRLSGPLGQGRGTLSHSNWLNNQADFPFATLRSRLPSPQAFPSCGPKPLGFYPIVDSAHWVQVLLSWGVKTIQLRIKDLAAAPLKREIKAAIVLAKQYQARLFINDYWQEAMEYGAYGVHLGQEDLEKADCEALKQAGLRLGISTHSYYEVARALAYKPSYLACGPIYHTNTKVMKAAPQGLERLKAYCQLLNYPVVAIGGIKLNKALAILDTGAASIAVITAITQAENPEQETKNWLYLIDEYMKESSLCNN
ncbi:thiamine phosphate synthase [Legionella sp. km772]|uniref:thiamine phosphate synthase n=1 Tax=Legionella sp. km772 TaxID=2498111 RepID=UPI000F8D6428|nr:thiamine phosphate synthase [Legionella sp. km772]RUR11339.1 thiamine phosphate synthase [Legionella sp. km772]